jgi:Uma2 family endonuclease
LIDKREEYAKAAIPEYWIVDPRDRSITVLSLNESRKSHDESGRYRDGQIAFSDLLDGFSVEVESVFDRPEAMN